MEKVMVVMFGPKNHFVLFAVEKIGHRRAGAGNHVVRALAGEKGSVGVGVGTHQIGLDGVHDLRGNLRAGGAIEKSGGLAVDLRLQGGKLGAHPGNIKRIVCRQNDPVDDGKS